MAEKSHIEIEAEHAALLQQIDAEKDEALAAAEAASARARNEHEAARRDALEAIENERTERGRKVALYLNTMLFKLLEAWFLTGSREAALACATGLRTGHAVALRAIGEPYAAVGPARSVLYNRVWTVGASVLFKSDPDALFAFANEDAGTQNAPGAVEAIEAVMKTCLDVKASPAEVETALRGLEAALALAARGNRTPSTDARAIFDLHRLNATPQAIARGFAELAAARKQREVEALEAHQDNVRRAQMAKTIRAGFNVMALAGPKASAILREGS